MTLCLSLVSVQAQSCLIRSRIQRVNGSLGCVMSEPNVISSSNPSLPETVEDSNLRWQNTVLTQVRITENISSGEEEWLSWCELSIRTIFCIWSICRTKRWLTYNVEVSTSCKMLIFSYRYSQSDGIFVSVFYRLTDYVYMFIWQCHGNHV